MIERGKILYDQIILFEHNKKKHPKPTSNAIKPPIIDTQIRHVWNKILNETFPRLDLSSKLNEYPYSKIKYKTFDCRFQFRNKLSLMVNCIHSENIFRVRNRDSRISSSTTLVETRQTRNIFRVLLKISFWKLPMRRLVEDFSIKYRQSLFEVRWKLIWIEEFLVLQNGLVIFCRYILIMLNFKILIFISFIENFFFCVNFKSHQCGYNSINFSRLFRIFNKDLNPINRLIRYRVIKK